MRCGACACAQHTHTYTHTKQGIIPRVIKKLFWALKTDSTVESSVTMCILEIYCDNIRDLGKAATRMELDAENDEGGGGGTTQQQSTAEWCVRACLHACVCALLRSTTAVFCHDAGALAQI
jgi:hypothetical protein